MAQKLLQGSIDRSRQAAAHTQLTERITLHRAAARALFRYPWPLNIRELEQALRTAVALTDTGEIRLEHLPEVIRTYVPPSPTATAMLPEDQALGELLIKLLREHGGNVGAVGRAMGNAPMQIRRWCYRMQIELVAIPETPSSAPQAVAVGSQSASPVYASSVSRVPPSTAIGVALASPHRMPTM